MHSTNISGKSALRKYLQEIRSTPLLSAEQERELAARVANGDPEARDLLVRANLRLVVILAYRHARRRVSIEDLVAEGNLGLMRAVEGYDGGVGVRFSTYASYWIKQSMRNAILKQGSFVRLPAYTVTLLAKWRRATFALTESLGRQPTESEVGHALGLEKNKLRIVREAILASESRVEGSLDGEWGDNGQVYELVDVRERSPEECLAAQELKERVLGRLDRLDARATAIVRRRFGLDGEAPQTLRTIGTALNLTRERIRQLERNALMTLAADSN